MKQKISFEKIILACIGIILVGCGIAFNASAALGNDPVGIVYDGVRNAAHLTPEQLGMASNLVNVVLLVIVFLTNRHYINIGTFIYILPYGLAVKLGCIFFGWLFPNQTLMTQIVGAILGCILLYTGVGIYIAADIGLDPITGLVMVIKDKVKKEYRIVKVAFDCCLVLLGVLLGGKIGVVTVVAAFTAGPCIQLVAGGVSNRLKKAGGKKNECNV